MKLSKSDVMLAIQQWLNRNVEEIAHVDVTNMRRCSGTGSYFLAVTVKSRKKDTGEKACTPQP